MQMPKWSNNLGAIEAFINMFFFMLYNFDSPHVYTFTVVHYIVRCVDTDSVHVFTYITLHLCDVCDVCGTLHHTCPVNKLRNFFLWKQTRKFFETQIFFVGITFRIQYYKFV